jgi:choline dehydrogenase-like flavoprotein
MSSKSYDYAIIGSGLPGLILASAISRWTSNIILLDGADNFGGCHKKINTPLGPIENGLRFFPKTQSTENALHFMEDVLGLKLIGGTSETNPSTYDQGQFKNVAWEKNKNNN